MRLLHIAIYLLSVAALSYFNGGYAQTNSRVPHNGKAGTLYKEVIGCASKIAMDDLQYAIKSKDYNSTMAILSSGRCKGARVGSTYTMIEKGTGRSLILVDGSRMWVNTDMLE